MNPLKKFCLKLHVNHNALMKEDPANVSAFLKDLSESQNLPPEARRAAKNLLEAYEKGQSLKSAMKSQVKQMVIKKVKEERNE